MFLSALILGFTGSLHCIGMCSPLAMAVTNLSRNAWRNRILYNTGRILTYSLLGAGAASAALFMPVSEYQNGLSIFLGIVLLAMGIAGISGFRIPVITPLLLKFIGFLKQLFARYLQKKTTGSVFLLGMLNGFLPCGLTFTALMVCLTLQHSWEGSLYMLLFGAGTLPAMLGLSSLINPLMKRYQWSIRHVMTVLLISSGALLMVRAFVNHTHVQHQNTTEIVDCR